jgi:hypothetical protein
MTFKFASAHAQVCRYCRFLVARTDRGLESRGRVADLLELPSPLAIGTTGSWDGQRFVVEGRVQLDRERASSAPWQEFYVVLEATGEGFWIAHAQGRWYWTRSVVPTPELPPFGALRPGKNFAVRGAGSVVIAEVGSRKVVSAEGELPDVPTIGEVTPYADFSAQNGVFGTLDYGDGQSIPPRIYLGRQFDPASMKLDSGQPLDRPEAVVQSVTCPGCGGSLPLAAPAAAERIVCRYCGAVSDVAQGALTMQGRAPPLPKPLRIPIGAEGTLRGVPVVCTGAMVRGIWDDGEFFSWTEYLLYGGPSAGYVWVVEDGRELSFVRPLGVGDVLRSEGSAEYQGRSFAYKQSGRPRVEYVVGEFYWKVSVGDVASTTDYASGRDVVSFEDADGEVNVSYCEPISAEELAQAFGLPPPTVDFGAGAGAAPSSSPGAIGLLVFILLVLLMVFLTSRCRSSSPSSTVTSDDDSETVVVPVPISGGGGSSRSGSSWKSDSGSKPSRSYGGPSFGGK